MAKLDQDFYYTGEASEKIEGYPGYTGAALTVTTTNHAAIAAAAISHERVRSQRTGLWHR